MKAESKMRGQLGFQHDHKRDEMRPGKQIQPDFINGPTGVLWLVDKDFSRSADLLMTQQQVITYDVCVSKMHVHNGYASYGRRLGLRNRDSSLPELCKLTKKSFVSGYSAFNPVIPIHKACLQWLGELYVAVSRCIEFDFRFHGQDLRRSEPVVLHEIMDARGLPQTNTKSPYQFGVADFPEVLRNKWLSQDDQQINRWHSLIGTSY